MLQLEFRNWEWVGIGVLFLVTYLSGLFIPLLENDSAQHASMAMRMVLQDDFIHLYKGSQPYLDKPHLHFWLAALSMKFFGINELAYRIPSLLFLLLGAISTSKLTLLLYSNRQVAILSAFVFLSAQTIILSAHDVRTDAILTGAVVFGVYHFVAWIQRQSTIHALFAGLGAAMALASKGMVGVGIIGLCIFAYLIYARLWTRFFNWRLMLFLLSFVVCILPLLYAYYIQFDLKPDQLVRGEVGVSGVKFILWDQSFKRFSGEDFGQASPDYFFFFHSLLWLLIPFSVVFYEGIFVRTRFFIAKRFAGDVNTEFLTTGGFWLVILLFSMSKFKLPHYLNSLIPICAIVIASFIYQCHDRKYDRLNKVNLFIQYILFTVGLGLVIYFTVQVFGIVNPLLFVLVVLFFLLQGLILVKEKDRVKKMVLSSFVFAAAFNLFLNTQFYPPLSQYQAGYQISHQLQDADIRPENLVMLDGYTNWTLDFYTQTNITRIEESRLGDFTGKYLFVDSDKLSELKDRGLQFEEKLNATNYRVTMVSPRFLNKETRSETLQEFKVVKIL